MLLRTWLSEDLSTTEESALRLDGETFRVANTVCHVDQALTRESKLYSLVFRDPTRYTACGLSALWVMGLAPEPRRHSLALLSRKRADHFHLDHFVIRDLRLTSRDYVACGMAHLVTMQRLVREIASDSSLSDHIAASALAICFTQEDSLKNILAANIDPELPNSKRMVRRLALADAIYVVDGFNTSHRVENSF